MSFEDHRHEQEAHARLLAGTLLQEAHTAGIAAGRAEWERQLREPTPPGQYDNHQQLMAEAVRKGTLVGVLRYLGTLQSNNSHVDDETYVPFGEMAGLIENGETE